MVHINKRTLLILSLGAVTAVVIGVVAFFLLRSAGDGLAMDANATLGMMPGIDPAQRLAELQNQLDESKIAFSINTNPEFSSSGTGNLMIENPANNAKLITAEVMLSGEERVIYKSGALKPGSYLKSVKLDEIPKPGVYDAVVYIKAYRLSDQQLIGRTGAQIKLTITS